MSLRLSIAALLLLPLFAQGTVRPHQEMRDIFYGEILYHAYQNDYFSAISHLDIELGQYYALDEPDADRLNLLSVISSFTTVCINEPAVQSKQYWEKT